MERRYPLLLLISVLFISLFSSCQKDSPVLSNYDEQLSRVLRELGGNDWRQEFMLPESDDLSAIPQDPRNPLSQEKVALGRLLFHEAGIALAPNQEEGMETYTCASCHFAEAGFQANRWQGIGDGGMGVGQVRILNPKYDAKEIDVQPIRSPAALNVAYQRVMLWNGQFGATGPNRGTEARWTAGTPIANNHLGYEGVETQAIAGLTVHRMVIDTAFLRQTGYLPMFDAAFPDFTPSERYSLETAGLAIAAYERTLLANRAPFQRWLRGEENAMDDFEKLGAVLFFGKAQCAPCHGGPALNSERFAAYGMGDLDQIPESVFQTGPDNSEHLGRGGFTGIASDRYKFKVPQLYNLKDSPFYGHGSTFRSIREVVAYKNAGQAQNPRVPTTALASEFTPLGLSEEEIDAISVFLEKSLYDPDLTRYVPDGIPSGLCFPFADEMSRVQLGCE